jgi:hypothetical protein
MAYGSGVSPEYYLGSSFLVRYTAGLISASGYPEDRQCSIYIGNFLDEGDRHPVALSGTPKRSVAILSRLHYTTAEYSLFEAFEAHL